jgi:hypothetical protein
VDQTSKSYTINMAQRTAQNFRGKGWQERILIAQQTSSKQQWASQKRQAS